jgi:hypothetical protein
MFELLFVISSTIVAFWAGVWDTCRHDPVWFYIEREDDTSQLVLTYFFCLQFNSFFITIIIIIFLLKSEQREVC